MKKTFYLIAAAVLMPQVTLAQGSNRALQGITDIGRKIYGTDTPLGLTTIIGNLVEVLLGLVGTIFVVLIIWSGFRWMTSGGNEKTIEEAKGTLVNSTIGLVIVLAGYSIAYFIAKNVGDAVSAPGGGSQFGS